VENIGNRADSPIHIPPPLKFVLALCIPSTERLPIANKFGGGEMRISVTSLLRSALKCVPDQDFLDDSVNSQNFIL